MTESKINAVKVFKIGAVSKTSTIEDIQTIDGGVIKVNECTDLIKYYFTQLISSDSICDVYKLVDGRVISFNKNHIISKEEGTIVRVKHDITEDHNQSTKYVKKKCSLYIIDKYYFIYSNEDFVYTPDVPSYDDIPKLIFTHHMMTPLPINDEI